MFFYIKSKYENDNRFVEFWENIKDGFLETKWLLVKISGNKEPMENFSYDKASRAIREQIIFTMQTIQQYATSQINGIKNHNKGDEKLPNAHEKQILRSLFRNTNASINSA